MFQPSSSTRRVVFSCFSDFAYARGGIVKQREVPVLITWDVDPDRWATWDRKQRALSLVLDLCEEFDIRSTFFITADFFSNNYPDALRRIRVLGHEIGCHGLTHGDEEEYNRMPEAMQRVHIEEATNKLEAATGMSVRAFRGPRAKISATTLRLLSERGYQVDSTVCSQRIDFVSSNLINGGWLVAPRRPYHPHPTNPFRRGDLPIWEVPISALIVPFLSGSLNVFGLWFMKALFALLYTESRYTGKPIVYLAHPVEFIRSGGRRIYLTLKGFSPAHIRTHGFLARRALYRMDGATWFDATREMFAYISSFPGVMFMTSSGYVDYLENHAATRHGEASDGDTV